MRLISCYVENFGKLSDFSYKFTDGLNVVYRENGWGKSTFMAFIKCMCYGPAGDRARNDIDSERKRYEPWQSGVYGGRLRFEVDGRQYEVMRRWGKKASEDECIIIDCSTNLPAERFVAATTGNAASLGRQLFGIDEDSFARSAFIAQGDVPGGVTSDINAKISNLSDNTNDMGNYEKAVGLLKKALRNLDETKSTGSLYAKKAEINRLKGELAAEEATAAGLKELRERIDTTRKETERLLSDNEVLCARLDEMTRWQDAQVMRERYKLYDKAMCEARTAYEDAERNEHKAHEADSKEVRLPGVLIVGIVLFFVGAVMAGTGLIMHGSDRLFAVIGIIVLIVGAVAAVIGAVMLSKAKAAKKEAHEAFVAAQARQENAYEAYVSARSRLDDYTGEYGTEFLNANDGKGFTDASGRSFKSGVEINDQIRINNEEIEKLKKYAASYSTQADEKQEQLDLLAEKRKELNVLLKALEEGRVKVRRLEMAEKLLTEAENNMTSRYIGPLTERFSHYFSCITGTPATSYTIDAQSNISIYDKGLNRNTATLSTGLKDAVGFCLRMALVDAMYKDQKPPIILDDAFANMDDNNYKGAIRVLAEVSRTYQVIYFTCHNMV